MKENFADVLESYMIAEEADSTELTRKDKIKAGLFAAGMVAGTAYYIRDAKKQKEKDKQREKERQEREARMPKFSIDSNKALQDSHLNLTPYPAGKWEDEEDIIDAIERDLKAVLPKILNCQEVMRAINGFCEEYNNCNKEEREDKYAWTESYPSKVSPSWFKSKFHVFYDGDFFDICDWDQNFRSFHAIEVIDVLKVYLKKKYANYHIPFSTGDGDEGCIYVD